MAELTAYQYELIAELHRHGQIHGLGLKETWEERYGEAMNHSRLYMNLDELIDAGLVAKSEADGRTNNYQLTDAGEEMLQTRVADLGGEL